MEARAGLEAVGQQENIMVYFGIRPNIQGKDSEYRTFILPVGWADFLFPVWAYLPTETH